jgi:uncharacterized damage-inducible protein DinB
MYFEMWKMGRTRLTNQLPKITDEHLTNRIHSNSNSAGWLLKHIAEVELLFAKNVFERDIRVKAQTIGPLAKDHGQYRESGPLIALLDEAEMELGTAIKEMKHWDGNVTTAEFGTVTKAEALARIMTHTAWHAGQLALIVKYGK